MAFGQWVLTHVLPAVPYRHFVLSIPKILRRFFLRDRRLLAAMGTHVPARGQQSVRYYGFLSNAARGKRRKLQEEGQGEEAPMPTVLEPEVSAEGFGKNSAWARFIQKVYEVDPLECPRCSARMRVISFITDPAVVRRILEHLGLWLANARPVPRAHSPPDPFFSQMPPSYKNEFNQLPPVQWDF